MKFRIVDGLDRLPPPGEAGTNLLNIFTDEMDYTGDSAAVRRCCIRSHRMNAVQYFDERKEFWRVGYLEKADKGGHGCGQ